MRRRHIAIPAIATACWFLAWVSNGHCGHPEPQAQLHRAAHDDDVRRMKALLARGAAANQTDARGRTALHIAASAGSLGAATLLLDHGAQINARDGGGQTPLHAAVIFDGAAPNSAMVRLLISKGAQVDARDSQGRTPLHLGAGHRSSSAADVLLSYGANVKAVDKQRMAPADVAAVAGPPTLVRRMVTKGARVTLHIACAMGDIAGTKRLLANSANVNARDPVGYAPLHAARTVEVAGLLLSKGAIPDLPAGPTKQTPLCFAARRRALALGKLLLERGADPNAGSLDSFSTPLCGAVAVRDVAFARMLIARGARVPRGESMLSNWAVRRGPRAMVALLVEHGAPVTAHTAAALGDVAGMRRLSLRTQLTDPMAQGTTPLHCAATAEVARYLVEQGCRATAKDCAESTPLHLAAYRGNADVVRYLLARGADRHAVDIGGRTPLDMALFAGTHDQGLLAMLK